MSENHLYRAAIPKIPKAVQPLWSVMIPTYNCAEYLRETLTSVLMQDPGVEMMQIEVIDDGSTRDDPAAVVEEVGQGRVKFYRQPQNVGHIKNFQTCLERARGKLIHLLHGDDRVRIGFYHKLQSAFEQRPDIGAAFCRHIMMDERGHWQYLSELEQSESGILDRWLERIAVKQRIQTPAIVVQRDVYEHLGGFDSRLSWSEDWEMWVRIAAHYPIWYEPEPLALYRMHSNSSTERNTRTGENMRDIRRAIAIFQSYLPTANSDWLAAKARENWALDALYHTVPKLIGSRDFQAAVTQIRESLNCSHSLTVYRRVIPLILRLGKYWLKDRVVSRSQFYKVGHETS